MRHRSRRRIRRAWSAWTSGRSGTSPCRRSRRSDSDGASALGGNDVEQRTFEGVQIGFDLPGRDIDRLQPPVNIRPVPLDHSRIVFGPAFLEQALLRELVLGSMTMIFDLANPLLFKTCAIIETRS